MSKPTMKTPRRETKVRVPKEVWVQFDGEGDPIKTTLPDDCTIGGIRYVLPSRPDRERELKEAVVRAAMKFVKRFACQQRVDGFGPCRYLSALEKPCARLELFRRSTRARRRDK